MLSNAKLESFKDKINREALQSADTLKKATPKEDKGRERKKK